MYFYVDMKSFGMLFCPFCRASEGEEWDDGPYIAGRLDPRNWYDITYICHTK